MANPLLGGESSTQWYSPSTRLSAHHKWYVTVRLSLQFISQSSPPIANQTQLFLRRDWTNQLQIPVLETNRSTQQIPTWEAKRARSCALCPLDPVHHEWRDWTNLGDGPAGLIADGLLTNDVADYMCFRAVCRTWRLWSTDPRKHGVLDRRFHPRQWIMLRQKGSPACRRDFMNVSAGYCRYVNLPELRGHDVFGPTTEGLLVLLDRTTWVVRILNPFTRQVLDLPPATTLLSCNDLELTDFRNNLRRDLLQVSGAGLAADSTIAVHFREIRTVAIIKPGDVKWTVVDRGRSILPALSFAGRFYCATTEAVMVVETSTDQPPRLAIVAKLNRPFSRMMMDTVHLVENDGELTLVDRECKGSRNPRKYEVYRVDMHARKIVPVHGLGGRAVFIGIELALSVSPSVFSSVNADTIYLGFDEMLRGYMDYSPINLMDGTSEPRRFKGSRNGVPLYGPQGVDDCLSWSVTGYRDESNDN
ncbi:unnamed protein product [Urochloa decumbens]|uniref:KIB1-4 beta-propeller domain-containing protein n=1 Tax=Urochloa decumbens TaxID=240449 RepID=A0ABC8W2H6_9POAL